MLASLTAVPSVIKNYKDSKRMTQKLSGDVNSDLGVKINNFMLKKTLIGLVIIVAAYLVISYGMDVYDHYFMRKLMIEAPKAVGLPPPPPPMMGMEAGPIKVNISEETPWSSIAKLLATVLGTYLGIKVINKYVK